MKILVLCHGGRWVLDQSCPTLGVPSTPDAVAAMTFLSSQAAAHPHVVADWTAPTRLRRHTFDVVTTACCAYYTFMDQDSGALLPTAFDNVVRVLKPGGFFVFTTAPLGVKTFARAQDGRVHRRPLTAASLSPAKEGRVLALLAAQIQARHPELRHRSHGSPAVRRWTADLAHRFETHHRLDPRLLIFQARRV